ncbi:PadR family transcriptional regulator, partial [Brevibacillus sp. SIMBA_076]|uniref:PadR family transcriptional regulator n=1 Tax=Brevibacillus sp. SIMBA_076 TaxID=3085814 RepID=UPI003978A57D
RRLTTDGYFTTYLTESGEGPRRKCYQITEQGKTHLTELRAEWDVFTNGVNDLIRGGDDR